MVHNGARVVNGMNATPPSRFSHSLTVYDTYACYAWLELTILRVCGQQSKLATFGGSNGGSTIPGDQCRRSINLSSKSNQASG